MKHFQSRLRAAYCLLPTAYCPSPLAELRS